MIIKIKYYDAWEERTFLEEFCVNSDTFFVEDAYSTLIDYLGWDCCPGYEEVKIKAVWINGKRQRLPAYYNI